MCITNSLHVTQCSGYQPPEYIDRGEISGKFDIFSLGVIIIRIVSGPESYPQCLHMPSDEFIDQVRNDISGPFFYLILLHIYIEVVSASLTIPFIRSVTAGGKSCRKHAVVVIPRLKHTAVKLRHAQR